LVIKYTEFPAVFNAFHKTRLYDPDERWFDVTDILGVKKWEPPIPAQLSGQVRGLFPSSIRKTDQERIQNLTDKLPDWKAREYNWEVTEKLDGTSMTVFLERDDRFGVCGRNWELTETAENSLWRAARANDLEAKMRKLGKAIAIQGELIGEGIQGNPYKLKGQQYWVYDIYDIRDTRYWSAMDRNALISGWGINHVPVIGAGELESSADELLKMAEGKSILCATTEREGLVFKCMEDPSVSFKAISNRFLLRSKD
jgi:RNA ligase (TIGR02306 family)